MSKKPHLIHLHVITNQFQNTPECSPGDELFCRVWPNAWLSLIGSHVAVSAIWCLYLMRLICYTTKGPAYMTSVHNEV